MCHDRSETTQPATTHIQRSEKPKLVQYSLVNSATMNYFMRFLRKQTSCAKSACWYFNAIHLPVILIAKRKSIPDHTFAKDEYMPLKH